MLRKLLFTSILLIAGFVLCGQSSPEISLKTYPLRFVYGLNGEITYRADNGHLISILYQHHQRDYFVIPGYSFDFNSFPKLEEADGYTAYLSYQFPIGDPAQTVFWYGPKAGMKDVLGYSSETNFQGVKRDILIDQQNLYLLGQFTLREKVWRLMFEAYLHLGAVNIHWEATYFNPDGSVHRVDDSWKNYWMPHFLGGFAIGYQF